MAFGVKIKLSVDENANSKQLRSQIQNAVNMATSQSPVTIKNFKVDLSGQDRTRITSQLQEAMNKSELTLKIKQIDASNAVKNLQKQLTTMLSGLSITGLKEFLGTDGIEKVYDKAAASAEKLAEAENNIKQKAVEAASATQQLQTISSYLNETRNSAKKISDMDWSADYLKQYSALCTEIERAKNLEGEQQQAAISGINKRVLVLRQEVAARLQAAQAAQKMAAAELAVEAARAKREAQEENAESELASAKQVINLRTQITKWINNNTNAYNTNKSAVDGLMSSLRDEYDVTRATFNEVSTEFARYNELVAPAAQRSVEAATKMELEAAAAKQVVALRTQISSWAENNTVAYNANKEAVDNLVASLQNEGSVTKATLSEVSTEFAKLKEISSSNEQKGLESASKAATEIASAKQVITLRAQISKWIQDNTVAYSENKAIVDSLTSSLQNEGTVTQATFKQVTTEFARLNEASSTAEAKAAEAAARMQSEVVAAKQVIVLRTQISKWIQNNIKAYETNKSVIDGIMDSLQNEGNVTKQTFDEASVQFAKINEQALAAGDLGVKITNGISAIWAKLGLGGSVVKVFATAVNAIKKMVSAVTELDAAMTELRKVTDLTETAYQSFSSTAAQMAKSIGATMSDTISATADFARLGYGLDDAAALAEAALVYKNVGDGITDVSEATESLISTIKAFGIEATDAMSIVDMFNEVGNNFAISSDGIGEALQRSAAALAEGGNTLAESIGLVTAMNSVVQNPESVGTSLKTLTMYLRAAKTEAEEAGVETDGMADSVSTLRNSLMELTGVDIMLDDNTFKSTYEIMKELSVVWSKLTDTSKSNVLNLLGGKRNANVISSLINNFSDAEAAMQAAMDSSGSAASENAKYIDSINGKISVLKASFEEMSSEIISSDIVKFVIEVGTALTNVVTTLAKLRQLLPAVIASVTALNSLKGLMNRNAEVNNIASGFATSIAQNGSSEAAIRQLTIAMDGLTQKQKQSLATIVTNSAAYKQLTQAEQQSVVQTLALDAASGVATSGLKKLTTGLASAWKAASMFTKISLILTIITSAIGWIQDLRENQEAARQASIEAAEDIISSYSEAQSSANSSIKSLESLQSRYDELSAGVDANGKNVSLTADEYSEFKSIVSQIIDLSPEVVSGYDSQGKAIVNYTDLIDQAIDAQNQYLKNSKDIYLGGGKDLFEGSANSYKEAQKQMKEAGTSLNDALLPSSNFLGWVDQSKIDAKKAAVEAAGGIITMGTTFAENYSTLAKIYENQEAFLNSIRQSGAYTAEEIDAISVAVKGLSSAYSDLEKAKSDEADYLMEYFKTNVTGGDSWYSGLSEASIDEFREGLLGVIDPLASYTENIANARAYGEEFASSLASDGAKNIIEMSKGLEDGTVTTEEYVSAISDFENSFDGSDAVLGALVSYFNSLNVGIAAVASSSTEATPKVTGLSDALEQLEEGYDILNTAQSEMAESGGISSDTLQSIMKLLDDGEKLSDYVTVENGLLQLNTEAWKNRSEQIANSDIVALEAQKAELESLIEARDLIASYEGVDMETQSADAQEAVANARDEVEGYTGDLNDLETQLQDTNAELKIYRATLDQTGKTDPTNLSDLLTNLEETSDSADSVLEALETLRSGVALNQSELAELAQKYPELMQIDGFMTADTVDEQESILMELLGTYEDAYDAMIDEQLVMLAQAKANALANSEDVTAIQAVIDNLIDLKGISLEDAYGTEEVEKATERYESLKDAISEVSNASSLLTSIRSGSDDSMDILEDIIDIVQDYDTVDLADFITFDENGISFNESGVTEWIDGVIDSIDGLEALEGTFPGITEWLKENAKANIETAASYDTLSNAISRMQSSADILQQISDGDSDLEILNSIIDLAEETGKSVDSYINGFDGSNIDWNLEQINADLAESSEGLAELESVFPGISGYISEIMTKTEETTDSLDAFGNVLDNIQSTSDLLTDIESGDGDLLSMLSKVADMAEESGQSINDFFDIQDGAIVWNKEAITAWGTAWVDSLEGIADVTPETRELLIGLVAAETEVATAAEKLASSQEKAQSAIDSFNSTSGYVQITAEDYESLIELDARYADAIEYQNGIMVVNSEKHAAITDELMEETKAMAEAEKQAILTSDEYQALAEAYKAGTLAGDDYQRYLDLNAQITGYEVLTNEIDNATSAYYRWVNRSGDNGFDRYSQALEAFELINETLNDSESDNYGRIGTDDFSRAVDFVIGEHVEVNTDEFDRGMELAERYLTEGAEGAANFYDDLVSAGIIDSTTGIMDSTIAEISAALGLSEEMVRTMIDRYNQYQKEENKITVEEPEVEVSETESALDTMFQSIDSAKESIAEINETPLSIEITNYDSTQEQVSSLEAAVTALAEAASTIAANPLSFSTEDLQVASQALTEFVTQLQSAIDISKNGSIDFDTGEATAGMTTLSVSAQIAKTALDGISSTLRSIISSVTIINAKPISIKTGNASSLLGSVSSKLSTIINQLNTIRSKGTITVRINEVTTKTTIGRTSLGGLANVSGTAMASGGRTLVGELGRETVVDPNTNRWYTVGDSGAEFVKLPEGAIVFNHKQTEELLGAGKISSRGDALASGNAMAVGSNLIKNAIASGVSKGITQSASSFSKFSKVSDTAKGTTSKINTKSSSSSSSSSKKSSSSSKKSSGSSSSSSSSSSNSALEDLRDKYQEIDDQLEHLIEHQEFLYDEAERGYNFKGMQASLEEQARIYKQKMENAQAAVKEMQKKGADDTSEELQDMERLYWEAWRNMYEVLEDLNQLYIDGLNTKIDGIQQAYEDLASAADEFNGSNGITVDTFQSLVDNGVQYLSLLENLDGQFVINRDSIEKLIALEKEQLAIESALSYINNIKQLLTDGDTNALAEMVNLTGEISSNSWDAVYAQAALLKNAGLSDEQFQQVVKNIDALRAISASVSTTLNSSSKTASEVYDDQQDALEEILKLTEDLIEYETEEKIDAINDQIDAYKKIIELKKEALETTKDEDDYEKNIAEKTKEIAKLQSQIDQLSLDDSREARAERASLIEELKELQDELADYQSDHSYDAQVDTLDKMADDYESSRQGEIDALESSISSAEKLYQLAIERLNSSWETLYDDIINWNTEAGSSLNSEITENWEKAAEAVKKYGSYLAAVNAIEKALGNTGTDESSTSDVVANGKLTDIDSLVPSSGNTGADSSASGTGSNNSSSGDTESEKSASQKVKVLKGSWYVRTGAGTSYKSLGVAHAGDTFDYAGTTSGKWFKIIYNGKEAWMSTSGSQLIDDVQKYHTGGRVGGEGALNDEEVLAILQKNETVLTEKQTSGLYKIIDFQRSLAEKLGHAIGNIAMPSGQLNAALAGTAGEIGKSSIAEHFVFNPTITVQISNNGAMDNKAAAGFGERIANTAMDLLQDAFSRRGITTLGGSKLKQ